MNTNFVGGRQLLCNYSRIPLIGFTGDGEPYGYADNAAATTRIYTMYLRLNPLTTPDLKF
jgi:hypothetical protein